MSETKYACGIADVKITGAADDSVRAGHLLQFTQSCELTFGGLRFPGFVGICAFNKSEAWDVTKPHDKCNGKYSIIGRKLTAP